MSKAPSWLVGLDVYLLAGARSAHQLGACAQAYLRSYHIIISCCIYLGGCILYHLYHTIHIDHSYHILAYIYIAYCSSTSLPACWCRVVADEIGRSLYGEMDFRLEAQHGEEFLRAHRDLHFVRVPEVVHELTTRR